MRILHCARQSDWAASQELPCYGQAMCDRDGFIHCSPIEYFYRVAPNFRDRADELLLLLIETDRLQSEVRWEDGGDEAIRLYPHVYGPIDRDAIVGVLPYLHDDAGNWIKNPELADVPDR